MDDPSLAQDPADEARSLARGVEFLGCVDEDVDRQRRLRAAIEIGRAFRRPPCVAPHDQEIEVARRADVAARRGSEQDHALGVSIDDAREDPHEFALEALAPGCAVGIADGHGRRR